MHSFVVQNLPEFIKANPLPTAKNPPMTEPIRAPQKEWDAVYYYAAAQVDPLACCLVELRDRVVALEAVVGVVGNPGHAPNGVTIHELTRAMERFGCDSTHAEFLWNDPRIGPLLRGEGAAAPVRVVLPERPPIKTAGRSLTELAFMAYRDGCCDTWAAARAEVERQQGGQADG